jgi:hypothetical protein
MTLALLELLCVRYQLAAKCISRRNLLHQNFLSAANSRNAEYLITLRRSLIYIYIKNTNIRPKTLFIK